MDSDLIRRVGRPRAPIKRAWPAVSVVLVLSVLCSAALAQQPSIRPFDSEEDLWEALNDGEITFDEFTELLDLSRSGADSLVLPSSDWEALPGSEAGYLVAPDSGLSLENARELSGSRVDIPYLTSLRTGVDADLTDPAEADGYSVVHLRGANWRANLDWEHDHEDGARWRRRSLIWQPRYLTIQAGSIEPRWGRGLVVGRRSRVIKTGDRSGNFDAPRLSRLDGVILSSNLRKNLNGDGFLSYMRGDSLAELAYGIQARLQTRTIGIGIAAAASNNGIPNKSFPDPDLSSNDWEGVLGTNVRYASGTRQLLAEIAINDRDATAKAAEIVLPLKSGRFHARVWSYGSEFINPLGGGPGSGDSRTIMLEGTDRTFSSRTVGERGFDFTTRIAASPNVNLRWDWMSHREEPGATLEHSGVFRAEIKRPTFRTTPFVRASIDEDETESYSVGNYLWMGPDNRELNVRMEFGTHYDEEVQFVRAGLGAKLQLNRTVRLTPSVRWNDPDLNTLSDGYWYIYFTEAVVPIQGMRVEMALAWKKYEDADRDDLVELRVRGYLR